MVNARIGKLTADIASVERAMVDDGFRRLTLTPDHLMRVATIVSDGPLYPVEVLCCGKR